MDVGMMRRKKEYFTNRLKCRDYRDGRVFKKSRGQEFYTSKTLKAL